jgi:hypothetical protein
MGSETHMEVSWTLAHDQLSFTKPEHPSMLANIPEGENEENIVTYMDFLDTKHPRQMNEDGTYDQAIE